MGGTSLLRATVQFPKVVDIFFDSDPTSIYGPSYFDCETSYLLESGYRDTAQSEATTVGNGKKTWTARGVV